jgi:enoyl-CoA hydratase/carnithine racemase
MTSLDGLETLRAGADRAIGSIVLDRPQKLNAMSRGMLSELAVAAEWFDAQRDVKVVVVRGEGRAFTGGADLTGMGPAEDGSDGGGREAIDLGRRMAEAVCDMRALTIAAIHGHCVGGGVVLATACDLRIAAEGTRFSIPEVDLGVPLTWSGIPRLVRELGPALTKELVLLCRPFDASEAHAMRFVNRVVPLDDLQDEATRWAEKLASQPAYALTLTKRHVNAVAEEAGSTAHSFREAETLLEALRDEESLAAMAAYLQRRAGS